MRLERLFRFYWGPALAVLMIVFATAHSLRADCSVSGGVACCGGVFTSGNQCCWHYACTDGDSGAGCDVCTLAKLKHGTRVSDIQKSGQQKNGATVLLAQLMLKDNEVSRALKSMRKSGR